LLTSQEQPRLAIANLAHPVDWRRAPVSPVSASYSTNATGVGQMPVDPGTLKM